MAHMHNFASTRHEMWGVIDDWLAVVTRQAQRLHPGDAGAPEADVGVPRYTRAAVELEDRTRLAGQVCLG